MNSRYEPPRPIEFSRKIKRTPEKIAIMAAGVLIIGMMGYLAIRKLSTPPAMKVESLLAKESWQQAALLNYSLASKSNFSDLRLLSYGVAINFALREKQIAQPDLPSYDYARQLASLDSAGIFEREAYVMKFSMFPESAHFLQELCSFLEKHGETLTQAKVFPSVQRALASGADWYMADDGCMEMILGPDSPASIITARVSGDNLILRKKPSRQSEVINRLTKDTPLLILNRSREKEKIDSMESWWYEVFTKEQNRGWVYGGYLSLNDPSVILNID